MAELKKRNIKICLLMLCFCFAYMGKVSAAKEDAKRAENGVVEVQSGFLDSKGKFFMMKSGSGFLIANNTNAASIVTSYSNVSNTPHAIKKYCKKHSVDTENMQLSNHIQIVVKADVTSEAEIVLKSAQKDYCVLSVANGVSQKESLKLGDSTNAAVSDPVYAYGFLKETGMQEGGAGDSEADVKMLEGTLTENETELDQNAYLRYTAPITQGYVGGPLLDTDGYVIGLNCRKSTEDDTGTAYALPINEIRTVLDNFSVAYSSRSDDEAYVALQAQYKEYMVLYEAGGYKRDSLEAMQKALAVAEEVLQQEEPKEAELEETSQMLFDARKALVPKMKKLTVLIIAAGICDGILFLWLLILVVTNAKEKRKMQAALGLSEGRMLYLKRKKTGQSIPIRQGTFIMGKNPQDTDYCITDNQTVSRKHAVLYEKNGSWYVDDLDSLNGTYVNGSRIVSGSAVRLKNGDEIALSDESFLCGYNE